MRLRGKGPPPILPSLIQVRGEPRIPASLPRLQSNESPRPLLERISRLQSRPGCRRHPAGIPAILVRVRRQTRPVPPAGPSARSRAVLPRAPPLPIPADRPPTQPSPPQQRPKMAATRKEKEGEARGTPGQALEKAPSTPPCRSFFMRRLSDLPDRNPSVRERFLGSPRFVIRSFVFKPFSPLLSHAQGCIWRPRSS